MVWWSFTKRTLLSLLWRGTIKKSTKKKLLCRVFSRRNTMHRVFYKRKTMQLSRINTIQWVCIFDFKCHLLHQCTIFSTVQFIVQWFHQTIPFVFVYMLGFFCICIHISICVCICTVQYSAFKSAVVPSDCGAPADYSICILFHSIWPTGWKFESCCPSFQMRRQSMAIKWKVWLPRNNFNLQICVCICICIFICIYTSFQMRRRRMAIKWLGSLQKRFQQRKRKKSNYDDLLSLLMNIAIKRKGQVSTYYYLG